MNFFYYYKLLIIGVCWIYWRPSPIGISFRSTLIHFIFPLCVLSYAFPEKNIFEYKKWIVYKVISKQIQSESVLKLQPLFQISF